MSFFGAILPGADSIAAAPEAIRPVWLRPVALGLIFVLHTVLFLEFKAQPPALAQLDAVDVTLEPLGDSAADQQKIEESQPEPPPAPPPAVEPPPELAAPPPAVVAPEAIPLPAEAPKPPEIAKPAEPPKPAVKPKPAEKPARPVESRQQKQEEKKAQDAAERRRIDKAQKAQQEARRGAAEGGAKTTGGMSSASYAVLLAAELRRHTFYPAAARAVGATGSVGVAFTVGPSGRVISQSVTRSSGNAALDSAAHAILSAIHTPPPPGGRFSTSTNLRFNFH